MFELRLVSVPSGQPAQASEELRWAFDRDVVYLGRRDGVDVQLPLPTVSGVHARIEQRGAGYTLSDERSDNGTQLNGVPVVPRHPTELKAGDRIDIGGFVLEFLGASAGTAVVATTPESTRSIARRMVRDVLGGLGNQAVPTLRVLSGPRAGTTVELALGVPVELGRDETATVWLPDADASRRNTRLARSALGTTALDLSSKNGTRVNGEDLTAPRLLRHGDVLLVGGTEVAFEDPAEQYLAALDGPAPAAAAALVPAPAPGPLPRRSTGQLPVIAMALAACVLLGALAALYVLLR